MASESMSIAPLHHLEEQDANPKEKSLSNLKKPHSHSPLSHIPSYLLPKILSYTSIPHLHYRLVNKEWDEAMKTAHSLRHCSDCCEVRCTSADDLFIRVQKLPIQTHDHELKNPWPLHWKLKPFCVRGLRPEAAYLAMELFEQKFIPYLESLSPVSCYSITIEVTTPLASTDGTALANWCLEHSNPSKYNFFLLAHQMRFETDGACASFLRSPSMRHVTGIEVASCMSSVHRKMLYKYSLSSFGDSDTVSNLVSLSFTEIEFHAEDAIVLAQSPHLTNLTRLCFSGLRGLHGLTGESRTVGFDIILCSPVMKNVKFFKMTSMFGRGYDFVEGFAQSKYLKNLTQLALVGMPKEESIEPLLRCDGTLPRLTSFSLSYWHTVFEEAMRVITSPNSALFNRIETLDLGVGDVSVEAMRVLCSSTTGLKALKKLHLRTLRNVDQALQLLASAASPLFEKLECLSLSGMGSDDSTNDSVAALYSSPNMPNLKYIDLAACLPPTSSRKSVNCHHVPILDFFHCVLKSRKLPPSTKIYWQI